MISLDLLFSTYNKRIDHLLVNLPVRHPSQKIIIVHQISKSEGNTFDLKCLDDRDDITYVVQHELGVTKSRNLAITLSTSSLLLFCDDDVEYKENLYDLITSGFNSEVDCITFKIDSTLGGEFRGYQKEPFPHTLRTILSIGTIEIACRREVVVCNNIKFPEDLGAGAYYPLCDEPVFLSKFIKSEKNVVYRPITIGCHPPVSSGTDFNSLRSLLSRVIAFKYIFGPRWAYVLFLLFVVKKLKDIPASVLLKLICFTLKKMSSKLFIILKLVKKSISIICENLIILRVRR